jgi:hypothetical protein
MPVSLQLAGEAHGVQLVRPPGRRDERQGPAHVAPMIHLPTQGAGYRSATSQNGPPADASNSRPSRCR